MEKRVFFRSKWLPWVLMAPQVAVIALFFFWPAAQALLQSVQQSDAFGTSVDWVGLDNFRNLWNDETYLASFYTTAIFSSLVAVAGISVISDSMTRPMAPRTPPQSTPEKNPFNTAPCRCPGPATHGAGIFALTPRHAWSHV